MDFEWSVFASYPTFGSGLVIELAIFAIAWLVVRRAIRDDRAERWLRASLARRPLLGGFLRTPTELAGTSGDSSGPWPRLTFLGSAVLFTTVLEAVMSHRSSDIYLDALPALRTPYQYPQIFLVNVFEVPVWIPIGWAVIFYLAMITSDRLIATEGEFGTSYFRTWLRGGLARAFIDALFALSIDFALDPIAAAAGWWRWTPRIGAVEFFSVPVSNFVAWFAIVFFLSLLVRTNRMFGLGPPDRWPRLLRRVFEVLVEIVPLIGAFGGVLAMVLFIYTLDARGAPLGVNSAFVLGAIVLFGALLVTELTLPFGRGHAYDRLVVLSVVALHTIFFGTMIWLILARQSTGSTILQVVPISRVAVGTSETVERPTVGGAVLGGDAFEVVVPGGVNLVTANTLVRGVAGLDETQPVHAVLTHEREVLLAHDPELSLWIPLLAGISVFLTTWPYMDALAERARTQGRHPFWILRLLLHDARRPEPDADREQLAG